MSPAPPMGSTRPWPRHEALLATGRYQRVKVEQSFTDSSSNRAVATVIFDEAGRRAPAATGIGVRTLMTISVLLASRCSSPHDS